MDILVGRYFLKMTNFKNSFFPNLPLVAHCALTIWHIGVWGFRQTLIMCDSASCLRSTPVGIENVFYPKLQAETNFNVNFKCFPTIH